MIDTQRLNEAAYCVLVLWLTGRYTTKEIAQALKVEVTAVKAIYRVKDQGGFMPKPRQFMTRNERQEALDYLRHYRMDNGRFAQDFFFTAAQVKNEPEEPIELGDPTTKAGKKQIKALAHEAQMLRNVEARERSEAAEGRNSRRGINADPLSWLYREKLLRDPEDTAVKGSLEKFSSEMRRHECGLRLRKYLEEGQLGGFKEISLERSGGGSVGVSIPERFVAARSALEAMRGMMTHTEYEQIVLVVHHDEFIWDTVSSKIARSLVLEDLRRALDVVALYIGMMESRAFEERWNRVPDIRRGKSRDEARDAVRLAREIIQQGVRQS